MSHVRDTAKLRFSEPIDGTKKGRRRPTVSRRKLAQTTVNVKVDKRVMDAAKKARREGERIVIIDETTVELRNG